MELDPFDIKDKVGANIRSCTFNTNNRYSYSRVMVYLPKSIIDRCTGKSTNTIFTVGLLREPKYHFPINTLIPVQYLNYRFEIVPDVYGPFQIYEVT